MKELAHFIENYDSALVVGTHPPTELHYYNNAATQLYGIGNTLDLNVFHSIFLNKSYGILEKIENGFLDRGYLIVDNVLTKKSDGQLLLTDVRLGYFGKDKSLIFIEITPKLDTRLENAVAQVNSSNRPAAILHINKALTITHSNRDFDKVFIRCKELGFAEIQSNLLTDFNPASREKLVSDILTTLNSQDKFSTQIKVFSRNGDEFWFNLELEKCTLDFTGKDYMMAYFTNIEKQIVLEEEIASSHNFFKAIQNFTDGILYRIDVKTQTLHHLLSPDNLNDTLGAIDSSIPDYINTLINNNIVHPDDHDTYRQYAQSCLNGVIEDCNVRFAITDNNYEWYKIKGYHVLDDDGELDQIIGTFANIEKELRITQENSQFNQYFSTFQELTSDLLYRVEMPSRTFHHSVDTAFNGKFGRAIPNHVNAFIKEKIIHPDDVENYLGQLREFFTDDGYVNEIPLRVMLYDEYQWCIFRGKKLLGDDGEVKEIFGALVNVDNEHKMQQKADTINSYFDALQLVSGESFYTIDIKTKVMTQKGKTADELNIHEPVPNFPETVFPLVHPDDLEDFKNNHYDACSGKASRFQMRILMPAGDYQWYELNSQAIFDNSGNIVEVVGNMNNINNEKIMQNELSSLNNHFEALQSISGESIYSIDVKNKMLNQKGQVAEDLGFNDIVYNYPESVFHMMHPDDLQNYKNFAENCMNGIGGKLQVRAMTVSGDYVWYEKEAVVMRDDDGNVTEVIGKMNNINDEKKVELEYSLLQQYFSAMQELSEDIIFHIEIATKTFIHAQNDSNGVDAPLVIPDFVEAFIASGNIHSDDIADYRVYTDNLFAGVNNDHRVRALIDATTYNWFDIKCKYLYDENKVPIEIFGKMINVQSQIDLEQKATIDKLTKALSREAFEEKIIHDLKTTGKGVHNALIFIDIDNFKFINDNYGHQFGDFILQQFTKRITNCIKDTDIIGRVGGDEFVVYLRDISYGDIALSRANIMLERMSRPISDGKITHKLGMSMGIAISPNDGNDLKTLYSNADKAVYVSKERGKNTATLYTPEMDNMELELKAKTDELTKTLNFVGFEEDVMKNLQEKNPGQHNALVCTHILDFEFINDKYGTDFADFILQKFVERMKNCIKKTDLVGRIDDDKFCVYLKDIENVDNAVDRATTIIQRMTRPFTNDNMKHNLDLSIGVSITGDDVKDWETLFNNVKTATDNSVNDGKNLIVLG